MHLSIYIHLLDVLWDHLDDEKQFRRIMNEGLNRYIECKREREEEE